MVSAGVNEWELVGARTATRHITASTRLNRAPYVIFGMPHNSAAKIRIFTLHL